MSLLWTMAVVVLTLKLAGVIDWSWWAVLAPLWGPPVGAFLFVAFAWIGAACMAVANFMPGRRMRR